MHTAIVAMIIYLKESNQSECFMPWIFNSQACESFYRQIRYFTSTYSTVASCSVNEIMHRVNRTMLQCRTRIHCHQNSSFHELRIMRTNITLLICPLDQKFSKQLTKAKPQHSKIVSKWVLRNVIKSTVHWT